MGARNKAFSVVAPKLWNGLPQKACLAPSLPVFVSWSTFGRLVLILLDAATLGRWGMGICYFILYVFILFYIMYYYIYILNI